MKVRLNTRGCIAEDGIGAVFIGALVGVLVAVGGAVKSLLVESGEAWL